MRQNIVFLLFCGIFGLFLYSGCKDTITGSQLDQRTIPDSNVSYQQDIQPIFDLKCSNSGCHDNASMAGGVSLSTWANTTADPGVVFPGKPDNSRLVWTIEHYAGEPPMPPVGYPSLTQNQIRGIRTWIQEGAKNN